MYYTLKDLKNKINVNTIYLGLRNKLEVTPEEIGIFSPYDYKIGLTTFIKFLSVTEVFGFGAKSDI